jgi:hypothetical protein
MTERVSDEVLDSWVALPDGYDDLRRAFARELRQRRDADKGAVPVAYRYMMKDINGNDTEYAFSETQNPWGTREPLYAAPAAPEGMVMVPREPSDAMIDAAFDATIWPEMMRPTSSEIIKELRENMRKEYRAMLRSAEGVQG